MIEAEPQVAKTPPRHKYNFVDRRGSKFGRLTVLEEAQKKGQYIRWKCRCDCGTIKIATAASLTQGNVTSCGCFRKELREELRRSKTKHGMSLDSVEYSAWGNMKDRCTNPKSRAYPDYGGRGITVDPRWMSFEQFFADMGERPKGATIDRRNNDLGYSKENCRWATRKTQQRNRRVNRYLTVDGVTRCLLEWSEISGIGRQTIYRRLKKGWAHKEAVFTPKSK